MCVYIYIYIYIYICITETPTTAWYIKLLKTREPQASSAAFSAKLPQQLRGPMTKSRLAKFPSRESWSIDLPRGGAVQARGRCGSWAWSPTAPWCISVIWWLEFVDLMSSHIIYAIVVFPPLLLHSRNDLVLRTDTAGVTTAMETLTKDCALIHDFKICLFYRCYVMFVLTQHSNTTKSPFLP